MASVAVKRQQLCNCVRCVFAQRKNSTNLWDVSAEGPHKPVRAGTSVLRVTWHAEAASPPPPPLSADEPVQGRGRRRGVGS